MRCLSRSLKILPSQWILFILLTCFTYECFAAGDEVKKLDEDLTTQGQSPKAVDSSTKKSSDSSPVIECVEEDKECEKDKLGLEAIKSLHVMIDDDHNGNVDQSESDEFLRDELQYTDGFERQALFHNNDKLISVDDLWKAWKHSTVYNWTVDDVIEWLVQDVDLPQYTQVFHNNAIDGSVLPRLVNSTSPLLTLLGIRNPVHKQKLSLKAMDTVLFGAPKRVHSYAKDLLLVTLLIIAGGGFWFACLHHRYSQTQVKKMMKDLESLQKAEESLKKLSKELAEAEKNQMSMSHDKQEELRMLRQNSIRLKVPHLSGGDKSPNSLSREGSVLRKEGERKLKQAEEELASLREALSEAENRLEIQQQLESQWSVPGELQAWLQLTHELEQLHYNAKRQAAERQLLAARDGCDKIKRRNKAFFGSLRMAHSNSLDDIDQSILDARAALEEVKQDLQERLHRWHTIELLCGFQVISNPGLSALKQALGRDTGGPRVPGSLLAPVSIDEADEDLPPADESADSPTSIYNQIPERQRQQIFAWARRSRLNNWMKKKKMTNGFSAATLPASGKSSTFLKKQGLMGSTGSLSHPHITATSNLVRRSSRDTELNGPPVEHVAGTTGSMATSASPVSFHLGENAQHERSLSNASLSLVSSSHTNGHQNQSRTAYSQSMSFPPYAHGSSVASPAVSPAFSSTGSLGSLTASNVIPRPGTSSSKVHGSPSGNHLIPRATTSHMPSTSSAAPLNNGDQIGKYVTDTGDVINNNIISSNLGHLSDNSNTAMRTSTSMVINPQQYLTLNQSNQLEDSDAASLDSIPRSQSQSALARARLDRSPELDLSSLDTDSVYSGREVVEKTKEKKSSKKKKFLPNFLQKKGKQKSS